MKPLSHYLIVSCWLLLICSSCGADEDYTAANTPYFRLKAYFLGETKKLYHDKCTLQAVAFSNDKYEEITYPRPDWYRQFDYFMNADINHHALDGKYSVDSMASKSEDGAWRMEVFYRAKEKDLTTRLLQVDYDSLHLVTALKIETFSHDLTGNTRSKLIYIPNRKIYIHSEEEDKILGKSIYGTDSKIMH